MTPTRVLTALTTALLLGTSRAAAAQFITVSSANVGTLTVTAAVAGSDPTPVSNSATTYRLVSLPGGKTTVMAALDIDLPPGVTLYLQLPSPGGGIVSAGAVALTTTPQAVLTNLPSAFSVFPNTPITYTLSPTAAAGTMAVTTRRITFSFQ